MSVRRPRITDADWRTIRRALNDAMDDRAGFASAWPSGSPEHKEAMALVRKYEALHEKLFGGPSTRQQQNDRFAATPLVSILELHLDQRKSGNE